MRSMLTIEQQQKPPRFSPQPTNGGGGFFCRQSGRGEKPGSWIPSGIRRRETRIGDPSGEESPPA